MTRQAGKNENCGERGRQNQIQMHLLAVVARNKEGQQFRAVHYPRECAPPSNRAPLCALLQGGALHFSPGSHLLTSHLRWNRWMQVDQIHIKEEKALPIWV